VYVFGFRGFGWRLLWRDWDALVDRDAGCGLSFGSIVAARYMLIPVLFCFQVDPKFLRNQRFAKKHNKKPEEDKAAAEAK